MPIVNQHCYCCCGLRTGALVSAIFFLLISAGTCLLYLWGLLDVLQREIYFEASEQFTAVTILNYILIGMHGVVMVVLALILFISAFCYNGGGAAFFSILLAIGSLIELGCLAYFGVVFNGFIEHSDGLFDETYTLVEIVWFGIRCCWHIHLIISTWSLFQACSPSKMYAR
ncbi:uncharacterized protein [Amphiura filiformis]|uniref:uncharacterized protein n=1 Tax=Amphiura filiformis TaxID=82378 RepID=UPI003B2166C3